MAELSAILFDAVQSFAEGAPQEDDMTVVLVKREAQGAGVTAHRTFRRSFDSLQDIFDFTAAFFSRQQVDPGLLPTVDLSVEELFTNMVKYSPTGDAEVRIEMAAIAGGVEVTLTDYDVDRFDVTQAPEVDISLPIERRRPGGLGLHLVRRLVDSIGYEYSMESRQSRITFRKTIAGRSGSGDAE
jgi:anti-sigma regulatory factor (Ser/Thr protein kinase)